MSGWAQALFIVSAVFAIAGAVGTVAAKSPLRAAVALLIHISALAGLFLTLHAQLLAAIQLLVYAGAVVVLFVFVIMLLGPQSTTGGGTRGMLVRTLAFAVMLILGAGVAFAVIDVQPVLESYPKLFGSVEGLGEGIYRDALLPFELVSITLLVAIIGAVAVARGRSKVEAEAAAKRKADREAAEAEESERARKLSAEVAAHEGH